MRESERLWRAPLGRAPSEFVSWLLVSVQLDDEVHQAGIHTNQLLSLPILFVLRLNYDRLESERLDRLPLRLLLVQRACPQLAIELQDSLRAGKIHEGLLRCNVQHHRMDGLL